MVTIKISMDPSQYIQKIVVPAGTYGLELDLTDYDGVVSGIIGSWYSCLNVKNPDGTMYKLNPSSRKFSLRALQEGVTECELSYIRDGFSNSPYYSAKFQLIANRSLNKGGTPI